LLKVDVLGIPLLAALIVLLVNNSANLSNLLIELKLLDWKSLKLSFKVELKRLQLAFFILNLIGIELVFVVELNSIVNNNPKWFEPNSSITC
jgi:hypothetical protein